MSNWSWQKLCTKNAACHNGHGGKALTGNLSPIEYECKQLRSSPISPENIQNFQTCLMSVTDLKKLFMLKTYPAALSLWGKTHVLIQSQMVVQRHSCESSGTLHCPQKDVSYLLRYLWNWRWPQEVAFAAALERLWRQSVSAVHISIIVTEFANLKNLK